MSDSINRTLRLKSIHYASGRRKDFEASPIEVMLTTIFGKAGSVLERHHPPTPILESDEWHCFAHRKGRRNGAFEFEYCTYRPGNIPQQMTLDLGTEDIALEARPIVDPVTGELLELVSAVQILAIGQILLVESVKGNGGVQVLSRYLTQMIRRYVDKTHPRLYLTDIGTHSLREALVRGGGAVSVVANMVHVARPNKAIFGSRLSTARQGIRNTELFRAEWRSKGGLNDDDVLKAFEESESEVGIQDAIIYLKNGNRLKDLDHYVVKKAVKVRDIGHRNPARGEVRYELRQYREELSSVQDGHRVINEHGMIVMRHREVDE